jgi:hypothetical protein
VKTLRQAEVEQHYTLSGPTSRRQQATDSADVRGIAFGSGDPSMRHAGARLRRFSGYNLIVE